MGGSIHTIQSAQWTLNATTEHMLRWTESVYVKLSVTSVFTEQRNNVFVTSAHVW